MFIIQLQDIPPLYWNPDKVIHPSGMWGDRKNALRFESREQAERYIELWLKTQAEQCKVIPY